MEPETRDVAGESSSGPSAPRPAAVGEPTLPLSRKESLPRGACRVCCEEVTLASDGATGDGATGDGATARPEEEVIMLGCSCRAPAHRRCMEAWTKHKGDRTCELCGKTMTSLPEPPPRPDATSPRPGDDFTVVMRPAGDDLGERVIVITQSQADGDGVVAIHRYYTATAAADERDQLQRDSRRHGCLSECFYLTVFVALFVLLFGGPGIVLGAMYVFWFIWIRGIAG